MPPRTTSLSALLLHIVQIHYRSDLQRQQTFTRDRSLYTHPMAAALPTLAQALNAPVAAYNGMPLQHQQLNRLNPLRTARHEVQVPKLTHDRDDPYQPPRLLDHSDIDDQLPRRFYFPLPAPIEEPKGPFIRWTKNAWQDVAMSSRPTSTITRQHLPRPDRFGYARFYDIENQVLTRSMPPQVPEVIGEDIRDGRTPLHEYWSPESQIARRSSFDQDTIEEAISEWGHVLEDSGAFCAPRSQSTDAIGRNGEPTMFETADEYHCVNGRWVCKRLDVVPKHFVRFVFCGREMCSNCWNGRQDPDPLPAPVATTSSREDDAASLAQEGPTEPTDRPDSAVEHPSTRGENAHPEMHVQHMRQPGHWGEIVDDKGSRQYNLMTTSASSEERKRSALENTHPSSEARSHKDGQTTSFRSSVKHEGRASGWRPSGPPGQRAVESTQARRERIRARNQSPTRHSDRAAPCHGDLVSPPSSQATAPPRMGAFTHETLQRRKRKGAHRPRQ